MLELLLSSGLAKKEAIEVPNSGPGATFLIDGDTTIGFFGEVTPEEFFNPEDIRTLYIPSAGLIATRNTNNWLKYIIDGRVCFVPKQPLANVVDWATVYKAGLVYGVDGNGVSPIAPGTNQYVLHTHGERKYKIRLFKFSTSNIANTGTWAAGTVQSEWGKIIGSLLKPYGGGAKPTYLKARYDRNDIFTSNAANSYILVQELTANVNQAAGVNTNAPGFASGIWKEGKTTSNWWWPVLELIPE